jgi:hypothetical protein
MVAPFDGGVGFFSGLFFWLGCGDSHSYPRSLAGRPSSLNRNPLVAEVGGISIGVGDPPAKSLQ